MFLEHHRALENLKHYFVVYFLDLRTPDGISYDWLNKRIYWTDAQENTISRVGIQGKKAREVILTEGLDEPRAIVVSPCDGYVTIVCVKRFGIYVVRICQQINYAPGTIFIWYSKVGISAKFI